MKMHFWRTSLLVSELKDNLIREASLKNYYLASTALSTIFFYLSWLTPRDNLVALAAEATGTVIVTIFGINAVFAANGGSSGARFIEKAVAISLPLLIKVFLAGLVIGAVAVVMEASGSSKAQNEWVLSCFAIVFQLVFYWRLAVHMRRTNA